jgi:hypothetical protein
MMARKGENWGNKRSFPSGGRGYIIYRARNAILGTFAHPNLIWNKIFLLIKSLMETLSEIKKSSSYLGPFLFYKFPQRFSRERCVSLKTTIPGMPR